MRFRRNPVNQMKKVESRPDRKKNKMSSPI